MAAPVTLKVSNRSMSSLLNAGPSTSNFAPADAKKSIRKLPTSLEITEKTTVQDVKVQLAKQAGGMDPERLGIYDAQKKKLLKDRKALVSGSEDVMAGKEILVKDLGVPSCISANRRMLIDIFQAPNCHGQQSSSSSTSDPS